MADYRNYLGQEEINEMYRLHREIMLAAEQVIQSALQSGDLKALGHIAHKVAGSAGAACLPIVQRLALELGKAAREHDIARAGLLATRIIESRTDAWQELAEKYEIAEH